MTEFDVEPVKEWIELENGQLIHIPHIVKVLREEEETTINGEMWVYYSLKALLVTGEKVILGYFSSEDEICDYLCEWLARIVHVNKDGVWTDAVQSHGPTLDQAHKELLKFAETQQRKEVSLI